MAMFDFLKPKWSAGRMTPEDRARQFWLLQRQTSYSAWERCRNAYGAFVDLVERQCKEEPIGRMAPHRLAQEKKSYQQLVSDGVLAAFDIDQIENWESNRTKWTHATYASVLRGLALYDQGLARLKQGDRSVFLHNSQGVLEDAANAAHHEYQAYYLGGPRGDNSLVFYGKYVPAMKAALQWGCEQIGFAADGLQSAMANMSAPAVWEDNRDVYNPIEKRKTKVIGSSERWKQQTSHLQTLPRVPQYTEDVFVRTGEPVMPPRIH